MQEEVLQAVNCYRNDCRWRKGIVVLPTGTGKTILSAIDLMQIGKKILFIAHRLDILAQSIDAYKFTNPTIKIKIGILTGKYK